MNILEAVPPNGVPGGALAILCRGFRPGANSKVLVGDEEAFIASASEDKVVVNLPESPKSLGIVLKVDEKVSPLFPFNLAELLSSGVQPLTNPAIAADGSIVTTVSAEQGQEINQSIVRITRQGDIIPYNCEITNPTGLAFSPDGQLYVSSRTEGTLLRYTDYEHLDTVAEDLGIPCGMVFDSSGMLYVGDRTGKIHRISPSGRKEEFAQLEPSISAFHLAIDSKDRLYVTGPTFAMRDCLYRFSKNGRLERLVDGLARPQGMAFLSDGDLLISAGYEGKKGVFKYSIKDGTLQHYVTAPILVGLAVSGQDGFLATSSSIYWMRFPGNAHKLN